MATRGRGLVTTRLFKGAGLRGNWVNRHLLHLPIGGVYSGMIDRWSCCEWTWSWREYQEGGGTNQRGAEGRGELGGGGNDRLAGRALFELLDAEIHWKRRTFFYAL